jgi:hypothetical protein
MKQLMQTVATVIAVFTLLSCQSQPVQLAYNPILGDTAVYKLVLSSEKLTLTEEVAVVASAKSAAALRFTGTILQLETRSGSDMDTESNRFYKEFLDRPVVFEMDATGKITKTPVFQETEADAAKVMDFKMFFPNYVAQPVVKGKPWKAERSISDIVFSKLSYTYNLDAIDGDNARIVTRAVYSEDTKMFKKELNGICVVNITTGMLQSASFKLTGFNGFSKMSGDLVITKLK